MATFQIFYQIRSPAFGAQIAELLGTLKLKINTSIDNLLEHSSGKIFPPFCADYLSQI
jgi:hypothetical protein